MVNDTAYEEILKIIKKESQLLGISSIGSEMLLLALVSLENSMTSLIFKEMGVKVESIREEIKKLFLLRKEGLYTNEFKRIIGNCNKLILENDFVYDEAYLYSLLYLEDNIANHIIKRLNIDKEAVLEELDNAREILEQDSHILVNLTKMAKEGKLNPFIGRENYIDRVDRILSKKQKNNPMLIGAAGVGKSGLVEGVTQYYLKKYPKKKIFRLDIGFVIAGTRYRGDLEERLLEAIDEVIEQDAIVFIDEIHNILSSSYNEASLDIANILKPILSRSEIKCIGATTTEEYYRYIYKDKALSRRFQNVFIDEVSDEECFVILKGIKHDYEKFYEIDYPDDVLNYIIDVSKLITNRTLPDKAIDLIDESGLVASRKKLKAINKNIIADLIFESIGIDRDKTLANLKNTKIKGIKLYLLNYLNLKSNNNIINMQTNNPEKIIFELESIFEIKQERILRIDLNDYFDNHYASNLIGAPSGYVGYENGGKLTEHLLKYPFAIVLFKNYRKCNNLIKDIIKSAIEKGYIIDNQNRLISLKNAIFIFHEEEKVKRVGFVKGKENTERLEAFINEII